MSRRPTLALLILVLLATSTPVLAEDEPADEGPQERLLTAPWARVHLSPGLTEKDSAPVVVLLGPTDEQRDALLVGLRASKLKYAVIPIGTPGPFPSHMDFGGLVRHWSESGLQWSAGVHRSVLNSPWILVGRDPFAFAAVNRAVQDPSRFQGVVTHSRIPAKTFRGVEAARKKGLHVVHVPARDGDPVNAVVGLVRKLQDMRVNARSFEHATPKIYESVSFQSADAKQVFANYYPRKEKKAPAILLCHQARSSKGEYADVAARLFHMGYTCLAIDQRSGDTWAGLRNRTAAQQKAEGKGPTFIEARPDIDAAIRFLRAEGHTGKMAVIGSSYSASLAVFVGAENKEVAAIVSFSPGDYLPPRGSILEAAARLKKPTLIVCPPREETQARRIFDQVAAKAKQLYVQPRGVHGASTLYRSPTFAEAWGQLTSFLAAHLK